MNLVPFDVQIPEEKQDPQLKEKLREEWPGILAWAVAGCREWQDVGLRPPDRVTKATQAYRAEMDILGDFLEDRCELGDAFSVRAGSLYASYKGWAEGNGEKPISNNKFSLTLLERGFQRTKSNRGATYHGLRICQGGDG